VTQPVGQPLGLRVCPACENQSRLTSGITARRIRLRSTGVVVAAIQTCGQSSPRRASKARSAGDQGASAADARHQRLAVPRRAPTIGTLRVLLHQPRAVAHIRLPADIGGLPVLNHDRPCLEGRPGARSRLRRIRSATWLRRPNAPAPASAGWVKPSGIPGALPAHLPPIRAARNHARQVHVVRAARPPDRVRAPQVRAGRAEPSPRRWHRGMRIPLDPSSAPAAAAARHHVRQCAFAWVVPPATLAPRFAGIPVGVAEGPLPSPPPAVARVAWVIYPSRVTHHGARPGGQRQHARPIRARACQPRAVQHHPDPDLVETPGPDPFLQAGANACSGTRVPLIVSTRAHLRRVPAQPTGALGQRSVACGPFRMLQPLAQGRVPNVDLRLAGARRPEQVRMPQQRGPAEAWGVARGGLRPGSGSAAADFALRPPSTAGAGCSSPGPPCWPAGPRSAASRLARVRQAWASRSVRAGAPVACPCRVHGSGRKARVPAGRELAPSG